MCASRRSISGCSRSTPVQTPPRPIPAVTSGMPSSFSPEIVCAFPKRPMVGGRLSLLLLPLWLLLLVGVLSPAAGATTAVSWDSWGGHAASVFRERVMCLRSRQELLPNIFCFFPQYFASSRSAPLNATPCHLYLSFWLTSDSARCKLPFPFSHSCISVFVLKSFFCEGVFCLQCTFFWIPTFHCNCCLSRNKLRSISLF